MNQRLTGLTLISLLLLMLLTGMAPQEAWANAVFQSQGEPDFGSALYRESFNDLQVKVLGGTLRATRQWQDTQWVFFPEWLDLTFDYEKAPVTQEGSQSAPEEEPKTIKRGVFEYHKIAGGGENSTLYRFDENKRITRTATGHVWSDRSGNEIHYDIDGKLYQIQNRYGVESTFTRDAQDRLYQVKDHHGEIRLTIRYNTASQVSEVEDYSGRKVTYSWNGTTLQSVTDPRGQEWKYQYQTLLNKTVMQKKISPEGRETLIEHTVIPGGVKSIPSERQPGTGIFVVAASGEGSALKQGYASVTVPDTLVLQAIKDQDGIGISYDYFYDAVKKLYTLIEKHPSGKAVEKVINLNGETTERFENGRLVSKTITEGRIRTTTNEQGQKTIREFDQWDHVLSVTYPDTNRESWQYNTKGDVTLHTDSAGTQTEYHYSEQGTLIRKVEGKNTPLARTTEYQTDAYGQQTLIKHLADANSAESTRGLTYDDRGNVASTYDGEGHLTQYQDYDAEGNVRTLIDPKSHVWRYEYDPAGNLLKSYSPLGYATEVKYATTYQYDQDGLLKLVTAPDLSTTEYGHDPRGRVRTIKDVAGKITTIERNPAGQVTRQIDSLNNKVEMSYDSLGRLKTILDGKQNTITLNYKDDGSKPRHQPDTIQYPKFKRSFEYDSRGRVTKITDEADGNSRLSGEFTYTKTGQRQTVKDAEGNTSKYEYDPLGRLEKIIDAYLKETLFAYDAQDNLLSVTDPQGSTTQYRYDRAGRQTQETRPLQQSYQFDYDERGSLSRLIDPKGNRTVYNYNPDGQLTQQQLYAQSNLQTPERTTEYHYTRSGQLESYDDGLSSANYSYTPTHQLQTETTHYGNFSKTVGYSYYDNGDLKTLTDPEGKINEYRYDANRQLESVTIPGVGIYTISSYDWFAPEEISWPGGTKRALEYDGLMQLKTITVKDPAETTQMAYAYSYDNAGNIKTKATEHGNYVYQYDNLYRLLEAQNPNSDTEKFTYDAVGNRKTTEKSPTPWLYNANHELQSRPQISYEYDANGSTTQITQDGQNTHLIYNAANRLAEIKNNDNQTIANYQYDPFGRRISKEVEGTTTYFIYTPQGLAGEYTSTGTLIRGYGYKPGGHWTTDPLYLKTGNTREQYFFYQNDHLGTPQKLMSTTGAIVWSAKYEAFGKHTPAPLDATAQPVENSLRFAGQYEDQETGWHYNWHRYYSPELGRYITSDPIGLEGGINVYGYAGGNPVVMLDPMGLMVVFYFPPELNLGPPGPMPTGQTTTFCEALKELMLLEKNIGTEVLALKLLPSRAPINTSHEIDPIGDPSGSSRYQNVSHNGKYIDFGYVETAWAARKRGGWLYVTGGRMIIGPFNSMGDRYSELKGEKSMTPPDTTSRQNTEQNMRGWDLGKEVASYKTIEEAYKKMCPDQIEVSYCDPNI